MPTIVIVLIAATSLVFWLLRRRPQPRGKQDDQQRSIEGSKGIIEKANSYILEADGSLPNPPLALPEESLPAGANEELDNSQPAAQEAAVSTQPKVESAVLGNL